MFSNKGRKITSYDTAEIFATAYNRVATIEKSVNGFKVCGLWPLDKNIFSEDDFASSYVIQPGGNNEDPLEGPSGLQAQSLPVSDDVEENDEEQSSPLMLPADALKSLIASRKSPDNPKSCQRKREKAEIITSSPFKKTAEILSQKKKAQSAKKKASTSKRKNDDRKELKKQLLKRKKLRKTMLEDLSDSDEEWPCLICLEMYKTSRPGEEWVQCLACKKWAHVKCSSGDPVYYCPNCLSDYSDED